jgi:hypothetical protein
MGLDRGIRRPVRAPHARPAWRCEGRADWPLKRPFRRCRREQIGAPDSHGRMREPDKPVIVGAADLFLLQRPPTGTATASASRASPGMLRPFVFWLSARGLAQLSRRSSDLPAASTALLLLKCFDDPHQAGIDGGDLLPQALDRRLGLQRADHRAATGALQDRNCARLSDRRNQGALENVSVAFCTNGACHGLPTSTNRRRWARQYPTSRCLSRRPAEPKIAFIKERVHSRRTTEALFLPPVTTNSGRCIFRDPPCGSETGRVQNPKKNILRTENK